MFSPWCNCHHINSALLTFWCNGAEPLQTSEIRFDGEPYWNNQFQSFLNPHCPLPGSRTPCSDHYVDSRFLIHDAEKHHNAQCKQSQAALAGSDAWWQSDGNSEFFSLSTLGNIQDNSTYFQPIPITLNWSWSWMQFNITHLFYWSEVLTFYAYGWIHLYHFSSNNIANKDHHLKPNLRESFPAKWWRELHIAPLLLTEIFSTLVNLGCQIQHMNLASCHHCWNSTTDTGNGKCMTACWTCNTRQVVSTAPGSK